MTADASEFSVGSGVEIEGSVGLGLESGSDQRVSGDANGIDCSVGEEKVNGRTGRLITMENAYLEESRQQDLDPDVKEGSVAVGDLEPIKMKKENGELTSEKDGDRDRSADPSVNVAVTRDDDRKDITTCCDMEEELVELDLGTVSKEEIGEALWQSVPNEVPDEKVRDIKSGICEVKEKNCNEEGNMELCVESGQDHGKDNSSREAAKLDLHVKVANKEGETLVKDMDFEKEESNVEISKDGNALVTAIDKDMDFENEESNVEVSKDNNSLVTVIDKDMEFEKEESNVEVSKDNNSVVTAIDKDMEFEKEESNVEVSKDCSALVIAVDKDMDFEKEVSNVEVRKDSNTLVTAIDRQGNLELSVYDDENQQCQSIVIVTRQEESKTSAVEANNEESKDELNNIHHEKEKGTIVRADEQQEIFTSNTDVDNQADRYINVLLLETEESQTVLTAPNKHDQEKLLVPETPVSDNQEQETLELATAEEESVEDTQALRTYAGNQCELVSAVEVQKEDKLEGLVTESQPHECSIVNERMVKPKSEECLEENRTQIVSNSITILQTVDGSVSFETHMNVPVPEISGKVDEAVPNGVSIGDIFIVEQPTDLHPKEDCCRSDICCVAEVKSSLEVPISTQASPDSGNGSSSCQDTRPSEQEVVTSSAVDIPSRTADGQDKVSNFEAENGSCIAETNENAAVNDVDAIESEFAISKETKESSSSLNGSVEVERSLDDEGKSVNEESGVIEESQVPVKEHDASTLAVEKVTASLGRPHACYIVKIPRFVDNQLSANIQTAQSEVNEKTQRRDSIKVSIEKQKVICNEFWKKFEDEKAEERTARAAVSAKRQQMESLQLMLNKLKNIQSVEELDAKIQSMEFDLQHVTMPLKEEKKYIHELKQLRQQRDQLTSNMGSISEMDEAFDQKEQIDERFNLLKKELDSLRTEVLRTEANANAARKKYDEQQQILRVLRQQFRDADALRQKAYGQWRELKNLLTERNKHFSMYKSDQISAQSYLSSRDFDGLLSHCSKQVENVMALWNNDEFRTQYVKSNLNSTLWRLRTPDGRSLGPDEEPPVIQTNQFRISVSPPQQAKSSESVPPTSLKAKAQFKISVSPPQQVKISESVLPASLEAKAGTLEEVESFPALPAAKNDHPVKPKKPVKPPSEKSKKTVTARVQDRETEIDENLNVQTKEEEELRKKEEELAMKEEELRKEKAAAELKEQQRLEEIAKAKAAEERKRRQTEKAQARAEFRAQKEAEKREKKRAKKQKKKGVAAEDTASINGADEGTAPSSETMQTTKELDVTAVSVTKKPPRLVASAKQLKKVQPIPLPLRKKGKRKMPTWMWALLTVIVVILLFLAGNYITLSTFSFQQPGL